jgi:hypothetical protein
MISTHDILILEQMSGIIFLGEELQGSSLECKGPQTPHYILGLDPFMLIGGDV